MRTRTWSRSRKQWNEDAVHTHRQCAVVVDGATPLSDDRDAPRETARFAHTLAWTTATLVQNPQSLTKDIAQSIRLTQEKFSAPFEVTATLSTVVWDREMLSVAVIGDSPVLLRCVDGSTKIITDPAFESREKDALAKVVEAVDQGATWQEAYAAISDSLRTERGLRNTDAGVWVVSSHTDPDLIAAHLYTESWPINEVAAVSLLSDGASAFAETFGLVEDEDFFTLMPSELDGLWERAESVQKEDSERSAFPRLSQRDDASVATITF